MTQRQNLAQDLPPSIARWRCLRDELHAGQQDAATPFAIRRALQLFAHRKRPASDVRGFDPSGQIRVSFGR